MSNNATIRHYSVNEGLSTLGPDVLDLMDRLDRIFLGWAAQAHAETVQYPALIRVEDLDRIDYFRNFPHLGLLISGIGHEHIDACYAHGGKVQSIPAAHLSGCDYALPSAACYNVYLGLKGVTLNGSYRVTTTANCFRNETQYTRLERLRSFRMREIVVVGWADDVKEHLQASKQRLLDLAGVLDLPIEVKTATDPFFDPNGARATMQRLFPVKEEFTYRDTSIASANFHRNFFGERCQIKTVDGEYAFSGCVGMGMERWVQALLDRYSDDMEAITAKIEAYVTGEHDGARAAVARR